jgi:hypothetical protein
LLFDFARVVPECFIQNSLGVFERAVQGAQTEDEQRRYAKSREGEK